MIKDGKNFPFHEKTDIDAAGVLVYAVGEDKDDETIAYSCPMGLELTARITTNYLQLKTIWNQRHEHKLAEWRDFCDNIYCLPFATDLIIPNQKKGN